MRRRDFIANLACVTGWAGISPELGLAEFVRRWKIGILETVGREKNEANFAALIHGLREHGYSESNNLTIEYKSAEGAAELFPTLASQLVSAGVDLIVTRGTPAARAAKAVTSSIPIVMAAIGEPLGTGVIANLAQPGGNVSGFSAFVTELAGKRIELLKEAFPHVSSVGFLQNIGNPVSPPQWMATQKAAEALAMSARLMDVRSEADIHKRFGEALEEGLNALSIGIDALTQAHAKTIAGLAAKYRILTIYPAREFVEVGGLLSYGPSYPDLYRRAAGMIDKIFKGMKPGDLPVEQPSKLELVVNLTTAKALDQSLPGALIARADDVLE